MQNRSSANSQDQTNKPVQFPGESNPPKEDPAKQRQKEQGQLPLQDEEIGGG
jgi:hypothetical protein